MLGFIFLVLMFVIFGKILGFAIKAAWSISKMVCSVILLPIGLLLLLVVGLIEIAFPLLVIIGVISLFGLHD